MLRIASRPSLAASSRLRKAEMQHNAAMKHPIVVEPLPRDALWRIAEIDRSEDVRAHFRQIGTELVSEAVLDPVPNFFPEGDFHSVASLVKEWQADLDAGGVLIGAFVDERLVGIAMLGTELAEGVLQLALLYVDRSFRRRGVGSALFRHIEEIGRDRRADTLYVSSVPTDSAVGFYLARGFRPTEPLPGPFKKEPEDVHMVLPLT